MENKVRELARISETIASIKMQVKLFERARVGVSMTKETTELTVDVDSLISTLNNKIAYLKLQSLAIIEELNLQHVFPRCFLTLSELKAGFVNIAESENESVVMCLKNYEDKRRIIKAGEIVTLPSKENYILNRIGSVLTRDGLVLKLRNVMKIETL